MELIKTSERNVYFCLQVQDFIFTELIVLCISEMKMTFPLVTWRRYSYSEGEVEMIRTVSSRGQGSNL